MPAPAKTKTWQYNVNQLLAYTGVGATNVQQNVRRIKTSLISFGTLPWTVSGSCNSVATGMDGVDRWTSDANLVWASGVHSWDRAQTDGYRAKFEICIDLNTAGANQLSCVMSNSVGFGVANGGTDGTTSARPTATDERVLLTTGTWSDGGGTTSMAMHAMQSSDGQCTRIALMQSMQPTTIICFEKAANVVSGWTNPAVGTWKASGGAGTSVATYANFVNTQSMLFKHSTTLGTTFLAGEGYGALNLGSNLVSPHDVTFEWPMSPVTLTSTLTNVRGNLGTLQDFYLGSTGVGSGSGYDSGGVPNSWVQMGVLVWPWNGTAVQSG
jgi:hypothetical protein